MIRSLRIAARALAVLATAWFAGFLWFAADIPRESPDDEIATDAIVVLTGGSERFETGLDLLKQGRGGVMFVSGVSQGVGLEDMLAAAKLSSDMVGCCVALGHAAIDTAGNATETADWVRRNQVRSVRLVTANYHMRRSLLEFRSVLPDVEIVPHPVVPTSVKLDAWWRQPGTARLILIEYNKYLAALVRCWFRTLAVPVEAA